MVSLVAYMRMPENISLKTKTKKWPKLTDAPSYGLFDPSSILYFFDFLGIDQDKIKQQHII